jgi:hypothetical protein
LGRGGTVAAATVSGSSRAASRVAQRGFIIGTCLLGIDLPGTIAYNFPDCHPHKRRGQPAIGTLLRTDHELDT